MPPPPLLAIFVGGKSNRMGTDKGLLATPGSGEPIVDALVERGRRAGFEPVLVGDATPYTHLAEGALRIADDPLGAGPLAGLQAALRHALQTGRSHLVAVACDMPHVTVAALEQLRSIESDAVVVAARRTPDAPWEPMLARYDARRLADALKEAICRGEGSFQRLFASTDIEALALTPEVERALDDWDRPSDVSR